MLQNRFQLLTKAVVLFNIKRAPFANQGNRANKTNRVFRLESYLIKRLLYRCFWRAVNTARRGSHVNRNARGNLAGDLAGAGCCQFPNFVLRVRLGEARLHFSLEHAQ